MTEPAVPKGISLIAAYRAERLRERPLLRQRLRERRAAPACQSEPAGPDLAQAAAPQPGAPAGGPPPALDLAGSIFASLVTVDAAVRHTASACVPAAPETAPETPPETLPADAPHAEAPLAEIGFGPGMLIRLGQLGLRTRQDLARADPAALRAALGDISRLIDVETWISMARGA